MDSYHWVPGVQVARQGAELSSGAVVIEDTAERRKCEVGTKRNESKERR